jgi:hypothetical protein
MTSAALDEDADQAGADHRRVCVADSDVGMRNRRRTALRLAYEVLRSGA